MQSRIQAIHEADAEVLAISVDLVDRNRKVAEKLKLEFPILSDPDLVAIDAYHLRHEGGSIDFTDVARPAVFILDRQGVVQWRDVTDNWRVRVRPETVLEQLSAIP